MLITSESSEGLTPRCDLYVTYTYNFYKLSSKRLDAICNLIALVIQLCTPVTRELCTIFSQSEACNFSCTLLNTVNLVQVFKMTS